VSQWCKSDVALFHSFTISPLLLLALHLAHSYMYGLTVVSIVKYLGLFSNTSISHLSNIQAVGVCGIL
jgi:hypothetical protein